jgi:phosphate-selective porin OprO/OprP
MWNKFMVTTLALMAASPALADDDRLQKLEDELHKLESEIAQLKQAQSASPELPKLIESPTHQFGLSSADGANSIAVIARFQLDAADYVKSPTTPLDSGVNARRARLGIGGTFMNDWSYRLIYDFGSSADSLTPGVAGAPTSGVENAYLTYNGFNKQSNAFPLAIDIGYLDIPWTLDEATSSNDIMFMERASPQVVATQFGGGDFRSAVGARSNGKRYWAGLYLTGPVSGAPHAGASNGNLALLGRAAYQLIQNDDFSLHFGANGGHLFSSRAIVTTTTATSIKTSLGAQSLTLSDRPELRVDPTAILNTGSIPAREGNLYGAETALGWGNFFAQGEYLHYQVNQNPGGINPGDGAVNLAAPDLNFQGGYAEASYAFGGRRRYIPETGAYSGVIPEHPFSLTSGGWGAFELAARFSDIDLNDHFTQGRASHLTGGVNGGEQRGIDVGLNWYPNLNVKFMLDYIHTDIDKLFKPTTNGAASSTPAGAHVDAVAARSQVAF